MPELDPVGLKFFLAAIFLCNFLVVINAIRSAKTLGGELGMGLKKIAAGTIAHVMLFISFITVEQGNRGLLTEEQMRTYFIVANFFGSILLILGYLQIYRISKKLKLF